MYVLVERRDGSVKDCTYLEGVNAPSVLLGVRAEFQLEAPDQAQEHDIQLS